MAAFEATPESTEIIATVFAFTAFQMDGAGQQPI